jgi:hypothetical protein
VRSAAELLGGYTPCWADFLPTKCIVDRGAIIETVYWLILPVFIPRNRSFFRSQSS